MNDTKLHRKFKVGDIFYTNKMSRTGRRKYKNHIVAIVEDMIVYRWYGKHKQWWHYEVEDPEIIEMHIDACERFNKE